MQWCQLSVRDIQTDEGNKKDLPQSHYIGSVINTAAAIGRVFWSVYLCVFAY